MAVMYEEPVGANPIPPEFIFILARYARVKPGKTISPNDSIVHDLRIYGDDADEMGFEIERQFGIEFLDHELGEFIPGEGTLLCFFWLEWCFYNFRNYKRFTVLELWKLVLEKVKEKQQTSL